jgi:hypothetical protein
MSKLAFVPKEVDENAAAIEFNILPKRARQKSRTLIGACTTKTNPVRFINPNLARKKS